jgi:hypothetical protein
MFKVYPVRLLADLSERIPLPREILLRSKEPEGKSL